MIPLCLIVQNEICYGCVQNAVIMKNQSFKVGIRMDQRYKSQARIAYSVGFLVFLSSFFRSRDDLEILALRQQLGLSDSGIDCFGFVYTDFGLEKCSYRCQTGNRGCLAPCWFPAILAFSIAFEKAWQDANKSFRSAIRRMTEENAWGAPRIHGELLKLGFDVSERTVSRYIGRLSPSDQARKLWTTFLCNHREASAAMDFFTVPTITFRVLDCFFVIEHRRRKILSMSQKIQPVFG